MIIDKKRYNVRGFIGGGLTCIDPDQLKRPLHAAEVLGLMRNLAGKFLDTWRPDHSPEDMDTYEQFFLGAITTSAEGKARETILGGHQLLATLLLLLRYLHRRTEGHRCQGYLESVVFFFTYGERRGHSLEALLHDQGASWDEDPESMCNLAARYRDIIQNFPEEITDNVVPIFVDWLLGCVTLDYFTGYTKDGTLILRKALAWEKWQGGGPNRNP